MGVDGHVEPQEFDPRNILVSDGDREHVSGLLQKAVGRGLITLSEFTERIDLALAARTRGELNSVLVDLPGIVRTEIAVVDEPMVLKTRSGTVKQIGHWVVPPSITAECTSGNVTVDFTQAECRHREVTLRATCRSGNIVIIVPRGWLVRMEEMTTGMGTVVNKATDPPDANLPVLRVYGQVGMGKIELKHPRPGRR
jgi:hypothetical protein